MAATGAGSETWKTILKLIAALVATGVLAAGFLLPYVGGLGLVAGKEADKFQNTRCDLPENKPPQRTTLYAKDGKTVLANLFTQDRVEIGLDQVPQSLQDALIATEDRRFYSHHGVDIRGLIRGAVNTTSGDTQGGSTLTMQYVKQVRYYEAFNDLKKQRAAIAQNLNRKIEDAKCAIYIEDTLKTPKKKILQDYLNIAFFGENSYGVQTAAQTYFNKPASKLEPQEGAMLVGLLRAPTDYDPFQNRVAAKDRRDEVLQNMVADNKLSQAAANKYKAMPVQLATDAAPAVRQGCGNSVSTVQNVGFFCDYVVSWLKTHTGLTDQQLQTRGYRIITTLDPKLQNSAQARIMKSVPARSPYTATLPVVEPKTGNVLAMAASKRYGIKANQTVQPIFTSSVASPGSTFKLFPLLTALNTGFPAEWQVDTQNEGANYRPKNCLRDDLAKNDTEGNNNFSTNETLTSAMVKSSNTFFVALADQGFQCKLQPMVDLARSMGISTLDDKVSSQSSKTIGEDIVGTASPLRLVLASGLLVSPLEMAGAYAGVANAGKFNPPAPVTMVYDDNGNAIDTKRQGGTQVVSAQAALRAVDIMKGDTNDPTGTSYDRFQSYYGAGGSRVAGKTGTALALPETKNGAVWFAGMTPDLAAVSAIVDFDNPNRPNTGLPGAVPGQAYGAYATKVWLDALQPTLTGKKWTWPSPDTVAGDDVPDVSGESLGQAKRDIVSAGFKMRLLMAGSDVVNCPSATAIGTVAFYGPQKAPAGSTVTVCQSLGVQQQIYTPPPPTPPKRDRPGSGRGGGGDNRPGGGGGTGGGRGGGNQGGGGGGRGGGGTGGGPPR